MTHVASCDGCAPRRRDACNLDIPKFERPTASSSLRRNLSRNLRGGFVERDDSTVEVFFEYRLKRLLQSAPPSSGHEDLQSESNFENGDRCRPDGFGWLGVEPRDHDRIAFAMHERRNHIGIEQNHSSNSAGFAVCPRISGISVSNPIRRKRAAIREPRPERARPSLRTALRRISRISSSVLRP